MIANPFIHEAILLFSMRDDDLLEASLPCELADKLTDLKIITFAGSSTKDNGKRVPRLRFLASAEWEAFLEQIRKQPRASGMLNSANALRYVQANSANCNISSGKLSLPAALAAASGIRMRARLFQEDEHWLIEPIPSRYDEENSSIPLLQEWLQVDHRTESGPVWAGKARFLETDYENSINQYINALIEAYPKDLRKFSAEIFDTLSMMAAHDDASSIDKTFWLCQTLNRAGYHPGISPLGAAIEHGAIHAVDALLRNGMAISFCGSDPESTTFQAAMSAVAAGNANEEFLLHLVECGAQVTLVEILGLFFFLGGERLTKKVLLRAANVNGPDCRLKSLLDEWDEILQDPKQLNELRGYLNEDERRRIRFFRPFMEACLQDAETVRLQTDEKKETAAKEERALLQHRLLANAELFAAQHEPELAFYHKEFAYFTTFLVKGDRIQHLLYGSGTVQEQLGSRTLVQFDSGESHKLKTIDTFLDGQVVFNLEEFQCRLFFSRDILERGEGMEASFKEAKSRIALLKQRDLPYEQLLKLQFFHTE